jgi:hypothetical protein
MPDHYPGTNIAKPPPVHTLTPEAEAARQASRAWFEANPLRLVIETKGKHKGRVVVKRVPLIAPDVKLVTKTPKPWLQVTVDELVGAPATFAKAALAAGLDVAAKQAGEHVCVGVRSPRIRAYWPGAKALVDGESEDLTYAKLRLTMEPREARAERERIREEAAAKRAASAAAKVGG